MPYAYIRPATLVAVKEGNPHRQVLELARVISASLKQVCGEPDDPKGVMVIYCDVPIAACHVPDFLIEVYVLPTPERISKCDQLMSVIGSGIRVAEIFPSRRRVEVSLRFSEGGYRFATR